MENSAKNLLLSKLNQYNTVNNYNNISLSEEQFKEFMLLFKDTEHNEESKEQIQNLISNIYSESARIINKEDSLYYIKNSDREKLMEYVNKLELFKVFFKEENEQTTIFFENLFCILIRIDSKRILSLFYHLPEYLKKKEKILYLYGCALQENKLYDDAIDIFDNLWKEKKQKDSFIQKLFCLLLQKNYDEVYKLTKNIREKDLDEYGFIPSYYLIARSYKEEMTENDIKKLNSKYINKPLFCLNAASVIKNKINKKSREIKEYIRKGYRRLNELPFNLSVVSIFANQCLIINENVLTIKYLSNNAENSIYLNILLLNAFVKLESKDEKDWQDMQLIIDFLETEQVDNIDINKAKAQLSLDKNKQLEAIRYLEKSFEINNCEETAANCLQLIIDNNDENEKTNQYINYLEKSKNPNMVMLAAQGWQYIENKEQAKNIAIKAMYLLNGKYDEKIYWNFWLLFFDYSKNIDVDELKSVTQNCGVILKKIEDSRINKIIIDSEIIEEYRILDIKCFPKSNDIAISLSNMEKNEHVKIDDKEYEIIRILTKEGIIKSEVINEVRRRDTNNKYFKEFKVNIEGDDPLKEIRQYIKSSNDNVRNKLDYYDIEKEMNERGIYSIPLSFFSNNAMDYQAIEELLLYNNEMKFYAGNVIEEDISNQDIVVDLTTMVMLKQLDKLELLKPCIDNIYITKSLKNKVSFLFKSALNEEEKTLKLVLDSNENLCKYETKKEDKKYHVDFWRDILSLINRCNIVEYEATIKENVFDKSQIDMLNFAIENGKIYVCEDLFIKKFANALSKNNLTTTNACTFLNKLLYDKNISEYIKSIKFLSKCKYIYCTNHLMLFYLATDILNIDVLEKKEEYKSDFIEIIGNLLCTKFLYNCYILMIREFLKIYWKYSKNTNESMKFFNEICEKVQEKSKEHNVMFRNY